MKTYRNLIATKSTGYAKISIREVFWTENKPKTYFSPEINGLRSKKVFGSSCPYYVGGGHPSGVARPLTRKGCPRAPPPFSAPAFYPPATVRIQRRQK
jgi:hypothetical protein